MPFCPYCGTQVTAEMSFCPNCGKQLAAVPAAGPAPAPAATVQTPVYIVQAPAGSYPAYVPGYQPPVTAYQAPVRADYGVLLIGLGTCTRTVAREVLEDLLGYSTAQTRKIVECMPTEIAVGLNAQQACTLAQALTEYGMTVSIRNGDGYVDMTQTAVSSVFDDEGNLLSYAMGVLSTMTMANRQNTFVQWLDTNYFVFAPAYRRPRPVRHVRYRRRTPPAPAQTATLMKKPPQKPLPKPKLPGVPKTPGAQGFRADSHKEEKPGGLG